MIKVLPTIPSGSTRKFDSENHLVAIALLAPIPGNSNILMSELFGGLVMLWLSGAGIEAKCWGCLFGPYFVLCVAEVKDRNGAVKALQGGILNSLATYKDLSEIAFYDAAELFWRTVHPQHSMPFDRFISKANLKWAMEKVARETEFLQAAHRYFKSGQTGE